jgi:hypothetical protein
LRRWLLNHGGLRRGLLDGHCLLSRGLEVALRLRLGAQPLDGVQHVFLLGQKRVSQPLR